MLADLGDAQQARAAVDGEGEGIAGLERKAARGQGETRTLARGPGLEQPHLRNACRLLRLEHERQIGNGDAAALAGEAARFLDGRGIAAGSRNVGELGGGGQVRLLRARQCGERVARAGLDEVVGRKLDDGELRAAMVEDDAAAALARIDEEAELQRLQRLARGEHAVDDEAGEHAGEAARVVGGKTVVGEDGRDRGGKRRGGMAAGDPVAEAPVVRIAPGAGVGREGGPGARIPGIDVDMARIDQRPAYAVEVGLLPGM